MRPRLTGAIRHLCRAGLPVPEQSDGQLLERFLASREEAAFESLLRRHGPMVLGVCRRLLSNSHDVEDAFQATFLVLVRKAGSIQPRGMVGNWLHGVAYRTALKARTTAARRRARERTMIPREVTGPELAPDWLPILDEELNCLPDKHRAPLVLCELEGKTRKEAARQLGWPEGTVTTRLMQGRRMLARRLKGRGITLAGGTALATAGGQEVSASVPANLLLSTTRAAVRFAAGQAAAAVVSTRAADLTEGVLKGMLANNLRIVAGALVLLALAGGVGFGLRTRAGNAEPPSEAKAPRQKQGPGFYESMDSLEERFAGIIFCEPMPFPAVLMNYSPDQSTLLVREPHYQCKAVTTKDGREIMAFVQEGECVGLSFPTNQVEFYNGKGDRLPASHLKSKLGQAFPVLVYRGRKPVQAHLQFLKEDTLIVVVPPEKLFVGPWPPVSTPPAQGNHQRSPSVKTESQPPQNAAKGPAADTPKSVAPTLDSVPFPLVLTPAAAENDISIPAESRRLNGT